MPKSSIAQLYAHNRGLYILRVSHLARDIIEYPRHAAERAQAVHLAAFTPGLFKELHETYGDRLPSDENLRVILIKKNFNPKAVAGVIRAYRDTITFLAEETVSGIARGDEKMPQESAYEEALTLQERRGDTFNYEEIPTTELSFKIGEDCDARTIDRQRADRATIGEGDLACPVFRPADRIQPGVVGPHVDI